MDHTWTISRHIPFLFRIVSSTTANNEPGWRIEPVEAAMAPERLPCSARNEETPARKALLSVVDFLLSLTSDNGKSAWPRHVKSEGESSDFRV